MMMMMMVMTITADNYYFFTFDDGDYDARGTTILLFIYYVNRTNVHEK